MTPADACAHCSSDLLRRLGFASADIFGFAVGESPPPKRSFCGASLEHAVMHDDEEEAERIREELRRLTDEV